MFVKQIRIHCAGLSYDFSGGGKHDEDNQTADPQQFQGTEPGAAEQGCHKEGRENHHRQEEARKLNGKEVRSMPKVGIYCRLSIEDKDKDGDESQSIQNQKEMLREYCSERNWEIFEIYVDA